MLRRVTCLPDAPSQPQNPLPSAPFLSFAQNSGAQRQIQTGKVLLLGILLLSRWRTTGPSHVKDDSEYSECLSFHSLSLYLLLEWQNLKWRLGWEGVFSVCSRFFHMRCLSVTQLCSLGHCIIWGSAHNALQNNLFLLSNKMKKP